MPDSSPEELVDTGEPIDDVKDPSADSSPQDSEAGGLVDQGDKPRDMLSAVKAALDPKTEDPPASGDEGNPKPESESEKEASKEEDSEDDDGDLTEDELNRLKPRTQRRIRKLTSQLSEVAPKAEQFDRMIEWIRERELTDQDINLLFNVGANLRAGKLREAYDQIAPIYQQLQMALGETLPPDLQQKVRTGQIDEASARALATTQANSQLAESRARKLEERGEQERQAQAHAARVETLKTAVTDWEQSRRSSDPDWNLKQRRVTELVELAVYRQGLPETAQGAVEMAETALKQVEAEMRQFRPRKPEVKPPPDAGSSRAEAAPKTLMEAARLGLAKARSVG